jgi:predicted Kef-type K+ transport protein
MPAYQLEVYNDPGLLFKSLNKEIAHWFVLCAAFLFFSFLLSVAATLFAVRAMDEMKQKHREEFTRLAVLSDALQFEPDVQT